ncbi:unnamed protein product [Paramecium sonneborni]|uniref:Uncharacterized protein n=1 Tax=Paramecium sonneborni TaxID=65129 RepID=A0A8S1NGQ5_9CILI|nr:unnamed protein product [Paramecium sonneborni]
MNIFGFKKVNQPEPTLLTKTKEELKDKQRSMNKEYQIEIKDIKRQNYQLEEARKKAEELLQKEIKKETKLIYKLYRFIKKN